MSQQAVNATTPPPRIVPARPSRETGRPGSFLTVVSVGRAGRPAATVKPAVTAAPTVPYTECPAIGADTSCGILVQVTDGGSNVLFDSSQGPYDSTEDTLIGLLNSSSSTVNSLDLSSNTSLFGFDGDGICTYPGWPGSGGCPYDSTGYGGPGTSFTGITPDQTGGVVVFSPGIPPGGTAFFSLEEPLNPGGGVTAGGPTAPEQGGATNPSEKTTPCSNGDPVNCATGVFWHTFSDLSVPGRGVPLGLTRTYSSSRASADGPFGYGWTGSYGMTLSTDPATGDVTITQENGSTVPFVPNGSGGFTAPPRVLASLTLNPDGSYTFVRFKSLTQYHFSAAGQLTSEVDRNGYQTLLAYNGSGQLATVTDPAGRQLTFGYTGTHVTSVTDPMGRAWSYGYDASGNLVTAADPMGRTWSYTYGSSHLLATMTDPRGGTTANVYDSAARVVSQTDPAGATTTWAYTGNAVSSSGGTTTITDPNGNVMLHRYANLELMSVTRAYGSPAAATTSYTYDPATLGVTSITDPSGNTTTNTYDRYGNLLSTANALGDTTRYGYNSLNEVVGKISPLGEYTSYRYDASGNLLSVTDSLGGTTAYAYADSAHPGDITSVTGPDGDVTSYTYDADGDLASVSKQPSATVTDTADYTYDADGERTCTAPPNAVAAGVSCPRAGTAVTTYNADGEVTSATDPDGHVTAYAYDGDGNKVRVTDAAGHVTTYTYDADSRQTSVTQPDGTRLTSAYDGNGNLIRQVNAAGGATTYSYDARGAVVSTTDPLGNKTLYTYDPAGNRVSETDAAGQVTAYTYNAASELTAISYSDGKTTGVTYGYDRDGHRVSMTDGTGSTSYSYDPDGRLKSVANGQGATVGYGYDPAGLLTSLTYPNGDVVNRTYDGAGELTSVQDWLGNTTKFSYDHDGNLISQADPNGVSAVSAYDAADQLTSITDKTASATLETYSYTRDKLGQVASATETGTLTGTQSYAYTQLSQLASDNGAGYRYDAAGNLTAQPGGVTQAFNAGGQLTAVTVPGTPKPPSVDSLASASARARPGKWARWGRRVTAVSAALTASPGDLVIAFVAAKGPSDEDRRGIRVSGGGLAWRPVARSSRRLGTAEIWQAHATRKLSKVRITATLARRGFAVSITLAAFRGAGGTAGAHAIARGNKGTSAVTLRTTGPDSLVWAVGADPSRASVHVPVHGQAIVAQFTDARGRDFLWTQKLTSAVTGAGTVVKVADALPATDTWDMAAVEIPAAAPSPARTSYGYSSDGDLTTITPPGGPSTALAYNQANELTAYGTSATYTYDGDGLRMSKTAGQVTTSFAWDQVSRVPLVIAAGPVYYVYGPGGIPVEQVDTGGKAPSYLLADQQNSTRLITSADGTVTGTYSYSPYGVVTGHTGTASSALGYDGQYTDAESGLQYLLARYYSPVTGQFLSMDPLVTMTGEPYGFGGGNPVNSIDPSGLSWYNPFSWSGGTWTTIAVVATAVGIGAATAGIGDVGIGTLIAASTGIEGLAGAVTVTVPEAAAAVSGFATGAGVVKSVWETISACIKSLDAECGLNAVGYDLEKLTELLAEKFDLPAGVVRELVDEGRRLIGLSYDRFKDWLLERLQEERAAAPC